MRTRPRLAYERWTDPVAGDILAGSDVDVVKLDLGASDEQGWAALESAHGYQVATRTDVASVTDGAQSDDTERLSEQLRAPQRQPIIERAAAQCPVGRGDLLGQVEHQTQRVFGHRFGAGTGVVAHRDSRAGTCLDVDHVIAGAR